MLFLYHTNTIRSGTNKHKLVQRQIADSCKVKAKTHRSLETYCVLQLLLFMYSPCELRESQGFFLMFVSLWCLGDKKRKVLILDIRSLWTRDSKWTAQDLCMIGSIPWSNCRKYSLVQEREKNCYERKALFCLTQWKDLSTRYSSVLTPASFLSRCQWKMNSLRCIPVPLREKDRKDTG